MVFVELTKKYERANKEERAKLLKAELENITVALTVFVTGYTVLNIYRLALAYYGGL